MSALTASQALDLVADQVQRCRENGETDLRAADLDADSCAELCCAIGKAMQPTLKRLGRICGNDPFSGRTDALCNLIAHVDREIDDATARCIVTTFPQVALEQAIRCAEAASMLGDDEAAEVRAIVEQFAKQRAAMGEVA